MINIITGPRNSGKSSYFLRLYQEAGATDAGLFNLKRFDVAKNIEGYDLLLLPQREQIPLARLQDNIDCFKEEKTIQQGQLVFSQLAFDTATTYILSHPVLTHVWIDEIGKLEIQDLGYASLIRELLSRNINMTLTIRDSQLFTFLSAYAVSDFHIL